MEIGAKKRLKVKRYTFPICGEFTDRESTRIIGTTYWQSKFRMISTSLENLHINK